MYSSSSSSFLICGFLNVAMHSFEGFECLVLTFGDRKSVV